MTGTKRFQRYPCALAFGIMLGVGNASQAMGAFDWTIECVTTSLAGPGYSSLALDGSGNPHVSFGGADYNLMYATKVGPLWEIELVKNNWSGFTTSIALAPDDSPRIACHAWSGQGYDILCATPVGGTWQVNTVDTGDCYYPSIAVDDSGETHISYIRNSPVGNPPQVKYAVGRGSSWNAEAVGLGQGRASLALDADARPQIAYSSTGGYFSDLLYSSRQGASWLTQTALAGGGGDLRLALDDLDAPCIATVGWVGPKPALQLAYVSWNGSSFDIDPVEDVPVLNANNTVSLAFDSAWNPHICYVVEASPDEVVLRHAYRDGASWVVETVDSLGPHGGCASMAIDAQDRVHIVYGYYVGGGTTPELRYAVGVPEPATLSLLALGGLAVLRRRRP